MVTAKSPPAPAMGKAQGVRQAGPKEDLASAPGGSDSIRSAAGSGGGGAEPPKIFPQFGADPEHAARVRPHATTYTTLLMAVPRVHERHTRPHERGNRAALVATLLPRALQRVVPQNRQSH